MLRSNQLSYITEGRNYSQTRLLAGRHPSVQASALKALAASQPAGRRASARTKLQYFHILFDIDLKFANINATEVKPCAYYLQVSCPPLSVSSF